MTVLLPTLDNMRISWLIEELCLILCRKLIILYAFAHHFSVNN